jgi:hypothetical protein
MVGKPLKSGKCPYADQIKTIEFTFQESRGPSYGRQLQEYLIEDEEFCMEIDSHTDFIKNWYVFLIVIIINFLFIIIMLYVGTWK